MIPRSSPPPHHRDRWMVSYLDMVTILLVFFVAAAAKTLAPDHKPQPGPPAPAPVTAAVPRPAQLLQAQPPRDQIHEKLAAAGIEVRREPRGLVASLPQAILFSPGDDRISAEALPMISRVAEVLRDAPNPVIVVGHADSVPIHNRRFRNNWELSVARGMRVLELLTHRYQIDERRLSVSGDGSTRPTDTNDTPEGRAANRRVELVILDAPLTNIAPTAD